MQHQSKSPLAFFTLLLVVASLAGPSHAKFRGASFLPTAGDEVVIAKGTGTGATASCPTGKVVAWGFKWAWSTNQASLPNCFQGNNAACTSGAPNCSSQACATSSGTTKQYVVIVCRDAPVAGLSQVTQFGPGAQSVSCPSDTVIAYGFSLFTSDSHNGQACMRRNSDACTPGAKSCATTACNTRACSSGDQGNESSFIYLICQPATDVTISSTDIVAAAAKASRSLQCATTNTRLMFGVAMQTSAKNLPGRLPQCVDSNNKLATFNSSVLQTAACSTYQNNDCTNDLFFLQGICVDVTPPTAPGSVSTSVQSQDVTVTFVNSTDAESEIDHYECQFSPSGSWSTCAKNQVFTLELGAYSLRVRAVNGAGLIQSSAGYDFTIACNASCETCVATNVDQCTFCAAGFYMILGQCVASCPENYQPKQASRSCVLSSSTSSPSSSANTAAIAGGAAGGAVLLVLILVLAVLLTRRRRARTPVSSQSKANTIFNPVFESGPAAPAPDYESAAHDSETSPAAPVPAATRPRLPPAELNIPQVATRHQMEVCSEYASIQRDGPVLAVSDGIYSTVARRNAAAGARKETVYADIDI